MKEQINWIQGLRGILCIWVVFFHYTTRYDQIYHYSQSIVFPKGGSVGVACFFILSGFFCLKTIDKYYDNKTQWLIKKYLRLWPFYIVCIITSFTIVKIFGLSGRDNFSFVDLIKDIPMIPYLSGNVEHATWYVMALLKFYMLIYIIARFKILVKDYFYIIILSAFVFCIIYPDHIVSKLTRTILGFLPLYCGLLLYLLIKQPTILRWIIYLLMTLYLGYTIHFFYMPIICMSLPIMLLYKNSIIVGLTSLLSNKPFCFIGDISYTWYLIHQNVGYVIMNTVRESIDNHALVFLIAVFTTFALACLLDPLAKKLSKAITIGMRKIPVCIQNAN